MRVLITGANGFVGRAILDNLLQANSYDLVATVRRPFANLPVTVKAIQVPPLEDGGNWIEALSDVDAVIHTAARVHVMNDAASDPLAEFRKVNVEGTLNLAQQAADAGVSRFIFISSIGVNGDRSTRPFTEKDSPNPKNAYAISKFEAEQGLLALSKQTNMELVIIRPPLTYGPNAPGNFNRLIHHLNKRTPLPLGSIYNKRSLIGLENIVDLIVTCLHHPAAANQIFLASDGEDLSTTELLRRTGTALGKPARLLPVPAWLISVGASLLGKGDIAQRLCGNLQVDISKTKNLLAWTPPVSVDEGLQLAANAYLQSKIT